VSNPVNMDEAKTELSRLVERALLGEEVIIACAGVPAVRLVPVASAGKRVLGQWAGRVHLADDFDAPLNNDDLDAWDGKS
jgi:prevent-host-death family protein